MDLNRLKLEAKLWFDGHRTHARDLAGSLACATGILVGLWFVLGKSYFPGACTYDNPRACTQADLNQIVSAIQGMHRTHIDGLVIQFRRGEISRKELDLRRMEYEADRDELLLKVSGRRRLASDPGSE